MTDTVLVTGTSTGIGLATAIAAAKAGWRVVATMRDTARSSALLEAAATAGVTDLIDVRALDVTDAEAAAACVDEVVRDHGRLDAVINNAGAGHLGTLEQESIDEVRAVFEVNFFGMLNVTKPALPHLRASGGRLLAVTSVGGVVGQPFSESYCAAKFAVEGYLESLAPVVGAHGVRVTVVEPGAVASEFVTNVGFDPAQVDAAGPYAPQLRNVLNHIGDAFSSAQSSEDAAAAIVDTLTADKPAFRVQTSEVARTFNATKLADMDGSAVQAMTTEWVS
ncbi:SDR family oxidoreductase [Kutzneria kofuensis]|uniref:NAD(P)-dependent dehydrogenase (Short-subunit alcohol dehydrogenase family) n=1 Tax=Kutzneria kofuensis TaxID=103725 RepID=A0A7W9NLW3_9PSEU|nr:SDR family oxidoreductase [Kutzneria kofuensis]MBB5897485.1 NAD(P)-dependent dehydrogenase (short-subunit alcohol dehydrogenase family) [Kutzneria kofuensis]